MIHAPPAAPHFMRDPRARLLMYAAGAVCVLLGMAALMLSIRRQAFAFDDAYVYFRYALNIRHGLGVAWNPDGVPTHGMPGQLWVFFLLPFTFLPFAADISLRLASWLTGMAALLCVALTVARHSRSELVRFPPLAFAAVTLPLLINSRFLLQLTSGMDTMLSLLANALLILGMLEYRRRPTAGRALLLAAIGWVAIVARPENALCALAAPLIAWSGMPRAGRRVHAAAFTMTLALLTGLYLFVCGRYFGSVFPADFPGKSLPAHLGFMSRENSLAYAFTAALCVVPFVGVLAATFRNGDRALLLAFILPAVATALCLLCVRQHMGFQGRYYVPFFPYIIVASLLCLDAGLRLDLKRALLRAAVGCVVAVIVYALTLPVQRPLNAAFLSRVMPRPVAVPPLITRPLLSTDPQSIATPRAALAPTDWLATIGVIGRIAARLPASAVLAAAEVGYLGCAAPDITILDLTGVNDAAAQGRGLAPDRLLERMPDLIWLPHRTTRGCARRCCPIRGCFGNTRSLPVPSIMALPSAAMARFTREWRMRWPASGNYCIRARRSRTMLRRVPQAISRPRSAPAAVAPCVRATGHGPAAPLQSRSRWMPPARTRQCPASR